MGAIESRRVRPLLLLILLLPAFALIVWLAAAQLPRWTAPTPDWLAANTPGVCAAVQSLRLYQARRVSPDAGIGREAARASAAQVAAEHYDAPALAVSQPLAVEAALPGDSRRTYYIVTARLSDIPPEKAAVIYLDATSGEPHALITTTEDAAADCAFDLRGALVAAAKSPPLLLLVAYVLIAAGVLLVRWLVSAKGLLR